MAEAGLTGSVEIRVQDYRAVDDGPFDAISSVGMAEHVGRAKLPGYAATLDALLRPGGRLLNHAISWAEEATTWNNDTFIARYVFPDGELVSLGDMINALTSGDLEVIDVEPLRQHYALTLRAWVRNLEEHWDEAVARDQRGPGPGVAAVHVRQRARLRGRQAGREPGAAAEAGRHAAAAAPRLGLSREG